MFNKVTIKGAKQAVQMFGPAQHAVAMAVADSVAEGVDPGGRGRQHLHLRRRVHPLGSGRRQEDPGIQLRGHQGIDRSAPSRARRRLPKWLPSASGQASVRCFLDRGQPPGESAGGAGRSAAAAEKSLWAFEGPAPEGAGPFGTALPATFRRPARRAAVAVASVVQRRSHERRGAAHRR